MLFDMPIVWLLALVLFGIFIGFLSGLLGIGGGLTSVPVLTFILPYLGVGSERLMHVVLATGMATVLITAASSALAHHKAGGVHWDAVKAIAPGTLLGTFVGTAIVARLSNRWLMLFFGVFVLYMATNMLMNFKPRAARGLPGRAGLFAFGGIAGSLSSMVSAGAAFISVPFLQWCGLPIAKAIGTSAAIGLPIAVFATLGHIAQGWGEAGAPRYSLGFVFVPALIAITSASVLMAPIGARMAHRLPVQTLKQVFACLLYVLGAYMFWRGLRAS